MVTGAAGGAPAHLAWSWPTRCVTSSPDRRARYWLAHPFTSGGW